MCFLGKRVERGSVRAPAVSCLNPRQQLLSLSSAVTTPGRRSLLWIQDRLSVMRFLIDTGAALSLVPAQGGHACTGHPSYNMVAANGTPITTYGIQSRHLALAPNHTFQWNFLVADAGQLILGADFLSSHDLLVDTKRRRLQHQPTKAYLPVAPCLAEFPFISHLHQESEFDTILSEFPLLFSMDPQPGKINHNIEQIGSLVMPLRRSLKVLAGLLEKLMGLPTGDLPVSWMELVSAELESEPRPQQAINLYLQVVLFSGKLGNGSEGKRVQTVM
ncbi:hypothetical protein Pcinc_004083 [Petrolisthes cinctipes]|uniref:Peptidase A2 domain-containing protein n=1 Tax=Petrolisthes cinctipes TaxID=88211 RepID=A0AAE1L0K5_PETCI|nr:hypothetical protein Pcinc_004083 [Petrolisthes cinctipes]